MNKRGAGVGFCAIGAFLHVSRYISAAIYAGGEGAWKSDIFNDILNSMGQSLQILSIISILIGIGYIIWGEIESFHKKDKN